MFRNKVVQNAKWIIGCKLIQSLLQMVIGMISARYLGPSNYGLVSYAASIVAFVIPIMQLGLRSTLVQEYVDTPEQEGAILGTSLVMNLCSSLACMVGVYCFVATVNRSETTTILVCVLYSIRLFFQAAEMVEYWFQAKLLSKYPSLAMLFAQMIVSLYKIYLLVTRKSVYWFALSYSIEYLVVAVMLFISYSQLSKQKLRFSFSLARKMFSRSKFYIISSLMVTVFQNTDHVMLKLMMGDVVNGYYTTAVTCAGLTTFVFMAIIDSARPTILCSRKESQQAFERNMSRAYSVMIWLAVAQSVFFTLLASPIVKIMYGDDYMQSVPVLRVVVWYTSFSCMGTVRNVWILAEGKQSILWKINLSGALMNLVLNAIFIPVWGAVGAAGASVVTQMFTNFGIGFLIKSLRDNNRLIFRGLNPTILLDLLKKQR